MPKSNKTQRTPPKTSEASTNNTNKIQANSEPNTKSALAYECVLTTNRSKRQRQNNSPQGPQDGVSLDSRDLDDKLACWKEEQDNSIAQLLSEQKSIMSQLATDIGEIKSQNSQIQLSNAQINKSNEEIVQSMSFMNRQFEDMKREMETLRRERQQQQKYIESLEQKITDLQRGSRSSGIELRNIPTVNPETSAYFLKTIRSIGDVIGIHVTDRDMRDIYRLPGKSSSPSSPRPIIAEFTSVPTQQAFLSAVRAFNSGKKREDKLNSQIIGISGDSCPVYVTEQLPASTKKLFFQARAFAKKNSYKFCWTSNGSIFLRKKEGDKQILIATEQCLQTHEEA